MHTKTLFAVSFAAAVLAAGPANAQLTVETTNFIPAPTATNGFEGLGPITGLDGVTSYSEDGISVDYIGTISGGGIWSEGFIAPEGQFSWYPDGGGFGYTRITFADTDQVQFLASSGFFESPVSLAYEVWLNGSLVGTGNAGPLPSFDAETFVYYGFSGTLFDEIRLQALQLEDGSFDPLAYEALALDAIAIGSSGGGVVPEPGTWAMMIGGIGLAGGALRRRQRVTVRFA